MFLTSHFAKLFNRSPAQQLAPVDDRPPTVPFEFSGDGELQETHFTSWELERRKHQDAMEEEEEEARPPYLHVWASPSLHIRKNADCCTHTSP